MTNNLRPQEDVSEVWPKVPLLQDPIIIDLFVTTRSTWKIKEEDEEDPIMYESDDDEWCAKVFDEYNQQYCHRNSSKVINQYLGANSYSSRHKIYDGINYHEIQPIMSATSPSH